MIHSNAAHWFTGRVEGNVVCVSDNGVTGAFPWAFPVSRQVMTVKLEVEDLGVNISLNIC
jgi:hypothetical protein